MAQRPKSDPDLSDDTRRVYIVIVDPKSASAQQLREALVGPVPLRSSGDPEALLDDPRRHRWVGVVIGPGFEDDAAALSWGRRLRAASLRTPEVLWLSASPRPEHLREASDAGFLFAAPPAGPSAVRPFLSLCDHRRSPTVDDAVKWAAWNLGEQRGLTPRQRAIVLALIGNKAACEIAGELGVSEKTVSNHITEISKRTGLGGGRAIVAAIEESARQALSEGLPMVEPTPPEPLDRRGAPGRDRRRQGEDREAPQELNRGLNRMKRIRRSSLERASAPGRSREDVSMKQIHTGTAPLRWALLSLALAALGVTAVRSSRVEAQRRRPPPPRWVSDSTLWPTQYVPYVSQDDASSMTMECAPFPADRPRVLRCTTRTQRLEVTPLAAPYQALLASTRPGELERGLEAARRRECGPEAPALPGPRSGAAPHSARGDGRLSRADDGAPAASLRAVPRPAMSRGGGRDHRGRVGQRLPGGHGAWGSSN